MEAPPFYSKVPIVLEDGFGMWTLLTVWTRTVDQNCNVIAVVSLVIYISKSESFWNEELYKNLRS